MPTTVRFFSNLATEGISFSGHAIPDCPNESASSDRHDGIRLCATTSALCSLMEALAEQTCCGYKLEVNDGVASQAPSRVISWDGVQNFTMHSAREALRQVMTSLAIQYPHYLKIEDDSG